MRFVYSAAAVCYIIKDWSGMDIGLATEYILQSLVSLSKSLWFCLIINSTCLVNLFELLNEESM